MNGGYGSVSSAWYEVAVTSTSMKSARNLYIPSGNLPVITIANHAAIQTNNAAIPYIATQMQHRDRQQHPKERRQATALLDVVGLK